MNWKTKARIQKIFSTIPWGERLNYFAQRYVLKNLPVKNNLFIEKVREADRHFSSFRKFNRTVTRIENVTAYEFGAGWDLIIPLAYYFFGIKQQRIIDLNPLLKFSLVDDSIKRFDQLKNNFGELESEVVDAKNDLRISNPDQLLLKLGIEYSAPADACKTSIISNSIDFVSSTNTIEHIPQESILLILKECYRIMKAGGIMSCRIDYQDHYAYVDSNISLYNFLKFSDQEWKPLNPGLQFQNRLRHKDYLSIISKTEFEMVEVRHYAPLESDLKTIAEIKLDEKFKSGYSDSEIAIRWAYFVLRKPSRS